MKRAGVNVVGEAHLLNTPQPLYVGVLHQVEENPVGDTHEPIDGVVENFVGFLH